MVYFLSEKKGIEIPLILKSTVEEKYLVCSIKYVDFDAFLSLYSS